MLNAIQWDSSLIRRYDQAGPRYTSYPTAVQFHERISQFDLLHALRAAAKRCARCRCMCISRSARTFATTAPATR